LWTTLRRLSASEPPTVLGRPLNHARVRILDRNLKSVAPGLVGELFVHVNDDVWYKTHEHARWRNDGGLELVSGRHREIHINGFRVDLEQIAGVMRGHPSVRDATVVAHAHRALPRQLVAYLVPNEGTTLTPTELRRALRQVLPERMVPRAFVELESLPRASDGSLDLSRAGLDADSTQEYVAPVTAMEVLLARIWKDALAVPRIGAHDNFFDLGGYSLLCFQVLERIEKETARRISPRNLLLDSLQQVAAQLEGMTAGDSAGGESRAGRNRSGLFRTLRRLLPGAACALETFARTASQLN